MKDKRLVGPCVGDGGWERLRGRGEVVGDVCEFDDVIDVC